MNPFTLTLPFPPSVNRYWRHVVVNGSARSLLSADGRKYKADVGVEAARQRAPRGIASPVAAHITLHAPDNRRRDVDNYAKGILDALVEAKVLDDDSQVRELFLVWGSVQRGGKAIVSIRPMPETPVMQGLPLMESAHAR